MNAINVVPKTVVVVPARTADINAVTWRTTDDAFRRRLHIVVNNVAPIVIEGAADGIVRARVTGRDGNTLTGRLAA